MGPNVNEEFAPRERGAMPDQSLSATSGDYGPPGEFGSPREQMEQERREREGNDRRFMREGERSASLERVPMEMKGGRPYGLQRGFYGGPRPDSRDMPIGYERDRMYDYGRMGRPNYGWPDHRAHEREFGRFPPEGRRDSGGYNCGYGEPFCPPYGPKQWGYGDRYRGGHDRSRRGDYFGMGSASRRSYSCAPGGYRYGPRGPFQPVSQPRYGYPGY